MARSRRVDLLLDPGDPAYVRFMMKLARQFAPLQRSLGVDDEMLEVLLHTKLILESRQKRGESSIGMIQNAGMALMMVMYLVLGGMCGLIALIGEDVMSFITVFGTMAFVMLLLPLLVDFAAILLDTEDVKMLSPLPVDDRTVLALRITHIGVYLLALMGCLGLGPAIIGSIAYNPLVVIPAVLLALAQAAALGLAGVLVLYLGALKSLDLSRFRDAMVYVQGGAFVVFYLASQLGPHLVARSEVLRSLFDRRELLFLWPPAANGALARLVSGAGGAFELSLGAVGWGATLGLVAWAVWLGRTGFVSRLAALEAAGGGERARPPRYGITGRMTSRIPSSHLERAGWGFFSTLTSTERNYKLRTMPMLVVSIMPFVMLFILSRDEGAARALFALPFTPYVLLFLVPGLWEASRFSETWEARRVLEVLSPTELDEFVRGARRAALVRFLVIPLFVVVPLVIAVRGVDVGFDLLLAAEVALCGAIWITSWFSFQPFTEKFSQSRARSNMGLMFAAALACALLGGLHFALGQLPYAVPVVAVAALPLVVRAWRRLPQRARRKRRRRVRVTA